MGDHVLALSGIAPSPKISGTCPSRCPFMFRAIAKRHTIPGSRLGRYKETGQPPGREKLNSGIKG